MSTIKITEILIKRGTTSQVAGYTGPLGELVMDTTANLVYVQDGRTAGGHLVGSGNTYGNANVAAYLPTYTGNVQAGNVRSNSYLYANGAPFVSSNYSNVNVASYLPIYSGNIAGGNVFTDHYFYANGQPFVSSNYGNANVAAYLPTYSGNITAGNVRSNSYLYANGVNILTSINNSILVANSAIVTLQNQVYSNANVAAYLPGYAGSIGGTVTTANQPNINQVGVLNSLSTAGDVAISGNLTVTGNINFIGNVTNQTVTGNSGQFFGDSHGFGALYAGISTGYTVQPQIAVQVSTNFNDYSGINMQNINAGAKASSDLIITADNGNASDTFIDIGIGSSSYNYPGYAIARPNDAYINVFGNAVTGGGNLIINTQTANDILFVTGGSNYNNEVMRITSGNVVRINSTNVSTSATSGALTVAGGVGVVGTVTVGNTVVVQGVDLFANVSSLANQIVTANTAMKSYVDTLNTTMTSNVAGANSAIVTANTALKSYTDTQITAVTTAWTANAATQATGLVTLDLKIIAANSYAINNVTGANATIQALSANVGSYYVWANANVAGIQGQITGANSSIQSLSANIGSYYVWANANVAGLQSQITGANATIQTVSTTANAFYTWSNANVAGIQGQITGANATIQALSANVGSYYVWANANVAGLQSQITGANSSIQSLSANVGGFYTYANATFATAGSGYGNANVAAYLPTYSGNIAATNIATNNYRFANTAPLSFSALVNGASTATLSSGGVFQAPAVQSDGTTTTQGPVVLTYSGVNNTLYKIAAVDANNLAIYGTRNTYFDTTLLTLNAVGGNATVSGNVVAPNYLFANGVNILSTVYGNTQVAQFLPTYTGNLSAANASVTNQFTVPFGTGQTATDIQRIILAQTLIA